MSRPLGCERERDTKHNKLNTVDKSVSYRPPYLYKPSCLYILFLFPPTLVDLYILEDIILVHEGSRTLFYIECVSHCPSTLHKHNMIDRYIII